MIRRVLPITADARFRAAVVVVTAVFMLALPALANLHEQITPGVGGGFGI